MHQPVHRISIAVDAMGGDYGSGVVVDGVVRAWRELGLSSIIVGRKEEITAKLASLGVTAKEIDSPALSSALIELPSARSSSEQEDYNGLYYCHADEVITMDDSPSSAIRGKSNSSIRIAFELVKKGTASAVVSPGNTGAVMAAGLFVSGTLPGIARPAIATLIPRVGEKPPIILLDSGANTDCHVSQLVQFAMMGTHYAKATKLHSHPRVALLSNGTESSKGNDMTRAAYAALSENPLINFVGYIEGRGLGKDIADVVVCDGFVGNIALKTMEGAVELIVDSLKYYTSQSLFRWRFGMLLAKPMLRLLFKEKLDPSSYGGAPLLGLRDIAIICHGSAKGKAIMNAVKVARRAVDAQFVEKIGAALSDMEQQEGSEGFSRLQFDKISNRFDRKNGK